jgi:LmbE family N-acetylglucosaminyl deacetylase
MTDKSKTEFVPKIVLGIAAHPDDLDFAASGSMSKWAKLGSKVYYLILTDGSKGTDDRSMTGKQLTKIREAEQRAAAKIIGAKDVFFLNYPDAMLEVTMDLKKDIVRIIRKLKPDTVITTDPTVLYTLNWGFVNHSDHRAAGQAAIDAVFPLARDFLVFPELVTREKLEPHKVRNLLLVNFTNSNLVVDISSTINQKIEALKAHKSQISNSPELSKMIKERSSQAGADAGYKYGERFIKIELMG